MESPKPEWHATPPAPIYKAPKPGRSLAQYLIYGFGLLLLAVGVLALYSRFAPSFKAVPNTVAAGMKEDRINIVLIGIGGDAHPGRGKDLADAIMVLSLKPSTRQAAMISIPRDYYVRLGRYGKHRINAAHRLGAQGYPGGGPGLLLDGVSEILDQPIHAFVRVDFAAFEKIIDELGGIDVYVQRGFHDFLFDDSFEQGWQRMNGQRALRFARYRYINSEEGNNYARELRQQQVLAAIKDKVKTLGPQQALRLIGAARAVSKHTATNLTTGQMIELYTTFRQMSPDQIRHVSFAPFTKPVKTDDPADPTPAVGPRTENGEQIHAMARDVFNDTDPIVTESQIRLGAAAAPPPAQ